jgi:hypothetical protein
VVAHPEWGRDDGTRAVPKGAEAQAAKLVGDELETPKEDGFIEGKNFAW